jgi:hypothetical protein
MKRGSEGTGRDRLWKAKVCFATAGEDTRYSQITKDKYYLSNMTVSQIRDWNNEDQNERFTTNNEAFDFFVFGITMSSGYDNDQQLAMPIYA